MQQVKPYVYGIQHRATNRWYVGVRYKNVRLGLTAQQDTDYWGSSKHLKAMMAEHPQGWEKTIIDEFGSKDEALAAEVEILELLWDTPGRVNRAIGRVYDATGQKRRPHSPETMAKIAASNRGKKRTAETKAKQSAKKIGKAPPNKGVTYSADIRVKMGAKNKGKRWYKDPVTGKRIFYDPEGFTQLPYGDT